MANLVEILQWENGIYQLELTDPVKGGADGIDNLQAKQLGNRTLWLKDQVESEATTRASADTTLQNNIDSEATTRASADTALQGDLTTHGNQTGNTHGVPVGENVEWQSSAQAKADTVQGNLDTEATTRSSADTTLQNNLTTHKGSGDHDGRYPLQTLELIAGNGMTGGGSLEFSRTVTLGSPGTLSAGTNNAVTVGSHTHALSATYSRSSASTSLLLEAKAMNDHRVSGDHDGRYYMKSEVDTKISDAEVSTNYGAVGTYKLYSHTNVSHSHPGSLIAGSEIGATGTWRCMGESDQHNPSTDLSSGTYAFLFVRVS